MTDKRQKLDKFFTDYHNAQKAKCDELEKKMQEMVDNPQFYSGFISHFGSNEASKSIFAKDYPPLHLCPSLAKFKHDPQTKFVVNINFPQYDHSKVSHCSTKIDEKNGILNYDLF